jgi:hypothetical protein
MCDGHPVGVYYRKWHRERQRQLEVAETAITSSAVDGSSSGRHDSNDGMMDRYGDQFD